MRDLARIVQQVLRANVNMASRLKNLERMHPALAANDNAIGEKPDSRAVSRMTCCRFTFEEELEMSPVYRRVGLNHIRFSTSSTSSYGPSRFSDLSLSDVTNVSAIALPISPLELWNHHRYAPNNAGSATTATSLEAWYSPSAQVYTPDQGQLLDLRLTSETEKRLYKNRLLQRPIYEPVRAIQVHRTFDIPPLHNHHASLNTNLHRRGNHTPNPQRSREGQPSEVRERRAIRSRKHLNRACGARNRM